MRRQAEIQEARDRNAWFRWEFIRRNNAYQDEQAAFQAKFGEWFEANGYWWDRHGPIYSKKSLYFLFTQIAPVAKVICDRWRIDDPFPPSWDFNVKGGMRREGRTTLFLPTLLCCGGRSWDVQAYELAESPDTEAGFLEATKDIPEVVEPSWCETGDRRKVRIEIDLGEPMQQILAYVQGYVEQQKSFYRDTIGPLPDHHRKPKTRLEEYEFYLNVWDLRNEQWGFDEIAAKLFPRETGRPRSRASVVERVRVHYRRACELIDEAHPEKSF